MIGLLCFVLAVGASPIKSKMRLEAENAVLRHQLIVLRRKLRGRVQFANSLDLVVAGQRFRWKYAGQPQARATVRVAEGALRKLVPGFVGDHRIRDATDVYSRLAARWSGTSE